ncbi:HAD-IIB family hydrolase [Thiomicrolovo sp. ZZH C-3]
MSDSPHYIVFTDLDATLLDHETYSHSAAQPAIDYLIREEIPLVFVTSKTQPEAVKLQEKMGLCAPFIVENGGAIFIPRCCSRFYGADHEADYEVITLGAAYDACTNLLDNLKTRYRLRGFSHMHHDEVAERTGLHTEGAQMAKTRYCSEPFIMEDESLLDDLVAAVSAEGFTVTKGGRFYHLIGRNQSKGSAVEALLDRAEASTGIAFKSIALGDSENDFSMLQSVDIPVLIPKHDGSYAAINLPNLIKAPYPGPRGWNAVLQELFGVA